MCESVCVCVCFKHINQLVELFFFPSLPPTKHYISANGSEEVCLCERLYRLFVILVTLQTCYKMQLAALQIFR